MTDADRRAEDLPGLAPTDLASVAEGRKEMLLGPQHHHMGCAYSWVGRVQNHCHLDVPHEAAQDPLLECSEVDVTASVLQVLSWNQLQHSGSSPAQAVKKGQMQGEMDWYLLWAVREVHEVLGRYPQHLWEAQANQATEKKQRGLDQANWAGCFWRNCLVVRFEESVY